MKCYCGKYEATTGGFDTQGKHNLAGCDNMTEQKTTPKEFFYRGTDFIDKKAYDDLKLDKDHLELIRDNYFKEVQKLKEKLALARRELESVSELICSEFCGSKHHPFCVKHKSLLEKIGE